MNYARFGPLLIEVCRLHGDAAAAQFSRAVFATEDLAWHVAHAADLMKLDVSDVESMIRTVVDP